MWTISGYDWDRAIITAAHCTGTVGYVQGTVFYQPKLDSSDNRVGEEVTDPPFQNYQDPEINCAAQGVYCRMTDVALVSIDDSVRATRGQILRPISKDHWRGPVDLHYNEAVLRITQKYTSTIPGVTLEKIGQRTGWTYGEVFETCVARPSNELTGAQRLFWVLCADGVEMGVYHGDSGAPVFRVTGSNTIAAYGVVFSGDPRYEGSNQYGSYYKRTYYSPFEPIGDEFPQATRLWPIAVTVDIVGPSQIEAGESAQWVARPTTNHSPPHTFRWYKNGQLVGTDSTYTTGSPWDFTLRVEFEDSHMWFDDDELDIDVVRDGPGGPGGPG